MANGAWYRVVRIDNGVENPHTGIVSEHRTFEAACKAVDAHNRKLHKNPWQQQSWQPYAVQGRYAVRVAGGSSAFEWRYEGPERYERIHGQPKEGK